MYIIYLQRYTDNLNFGQTRIHTNPRISLFYATRMSDVANQFVLYQFLYPCATDQNQIDLRARVLFSGQDAYLLLISAAHPRIQMYARNLLWIRSRSSLKNSHYCLELLLLWRPCWKCEAAVEMSSN